MSNPRNKQSRALHPSTPSHPSSTQWHLRLTGKGHAEDGDAAENALPADVADPLQPLPTEEAMLEGGQHNLDRGESRAEGQ